VILTADHGEQFGEHGLFLHGNSLYQPLLDVPLLIRFPAAVPAGRRIESRATLRDLAATILDVLKVPGDSGLAGVSLARHWSDESARRAPPDRNVAIAEVREADWAKEGNPWYPAARGDMASVTDDAYHYIRNGDGREELYAIALDPDERRDLGQLPESAPILERSRQTLQASVKAVSR